MDLSSLGAGAGIVVIILTIVFGFLTKMKWLIIGNGNSSQSKNYSKYSHSTSTDMREKINNIERSTSNIERFWKENEGEIKLMFKQTDELQQLHNVRDENGIPMWYRSKALDSVVSTQARALNDIALTLQRFELIIENQNKMTERQNKIYEKMFDKIDKKLSDNI